VNARTIGEVRPTCIVSTARLAPPDLLPSVVNVPRLALYKTFAENPEPYSIR
jgi:hypothetical protein